jgi:steroid delta-isomerase-like uncharacterized protein
LRYRTEPKRLMLGLRCGRQMIRTLAPREGENMIRQTNQACLRAHLDAEGEHDMEATLATLHPECVFVDEPLGLRFEGREGAREHYAMWWSAFGNTLDGGELHWVEDDLAIGDATFVGRHVGPFAGLPPTGRPMRLPFVVFVRFRDGLLAGERFVYDLNGLLRQLGWPAFEPAVA